MVVDGRHPERAGGGDLGGLVLLLLAGDFDDQVEQVVRAVAVVDAGDEVGDVVVFLAVERVGDREAEVVVLDVADDLGHVFQGLGHLLLPGVGVGDDVGDVALVGAGGVDGAGGVEVDVAGGADGVIGRRIGLRAAVAVGRGDDGLVDAVGGVVGELDQQQQLREGVVLAA